MSNDVTNIDCLLANVCSTSSSCLRGFWIAKAVQYLQHSREIDKYGSYKERLDELLGDYRKFETSLSRNVADRVFYAADPNDIAPKIEDLLNAEGELNMCFFSKLKLVSKSLLYLIIILIII